MPWGLNDLRAGARFRLTISGARPTLHLNGFAESIGVSPMARALLLCMVEADMSDKARTVSERAVRKASGERLLRDFARAARLVQFCRSDEGEMFAVCAERETSRTRYACLMTAFGQ